MWALRVTYVHLIFHARRLQTDTPRWACQALDRNVAYDGMPYVYQQFPVLLRKVIVERFPHLRLYIERFDSDARISAFDGLSNIRGLKMNRHGGPGPDPEFFYNLKNLDSLDFQVYSDFEFHNFAQGRRLPPIQDLKIGQHTYMAGVHKDIWDLSRLRSLEVSHAYNAFPPSTHSATSTFESLPPQTLANLKILKYDLPTVAWDSERRFPIEILDHVDALRILHLNTDLESSNMSYIGRHGDTLEELNLGSIPGIIDRESRSVLELPDLGNLQQSCWHLQCLSVNINLNGTDVSSYQFVTISLS